MNGIIKSLIIVSLAAVGVKIIKDKNKSIIEKIAERISQPISIDELANLYSEASDKIILEGIKEGYKFVGGKLIISLAENPNKLKIAVEIYYKDENDRWIKKHNQSIVSIKKLKEESINEIKSKNQIEYDLEEPGTQAI